MTKSSSRTVLLTAVAALSLALPAGASAAPPDVNAAVATFDYTSNLKPLGFSPAGRYLPTTRSRVRAASTPT